MNLKFVKHEKILLQKHSALNERWVQERIEDDPSILGLGDDLRLLDRERTLRGGGRLDLLIIDDENNRRYEIELQLGKTDAGHIVRCIEYWDLERKKYPGYEHVAVIIAEDVTARFLNVISLMAGSIPIIAIQLDALQFGDNLLLNFVQVLDQTDLRIDDDDAESGGGGGPVERIFWEQKSGENLLKICDECLSFINEASKTTWEMNYLRGYIGLSSGGVVNNFIHFGPRKGKSYTHIIFRNADAKEWVERFEELGVPAISKRKDRIRLSLSPGEFQSHKDVVKELVESTVNQLEA